MKNIFKIELKRAFFNINTLLSLGIGITMVMLHLFFLVLPLSKSLNEYMSYNLPMMYPGWLFSSWFGGNRANIYVFSFFIIIPLISALPFGDSFFSDVKGGVINNICTRCNKKHYYLSKYISVFLSGGFTVVFPLFLNLIFSMLLLPSLKPEVSTFNTLIREASTFSHLYFTHPFIFILIKLFMLFLFSGILATTALWASYYLNHQFLVVISPFIIYLTIISIFSMVNKASWIPSNFLVPAYENPYLIAFFVQFIFLFILSLFKFLIKSLRGDIY